MHVSLRVCARMYLFFLCMLICIGKWIGDVRQAHISNKRLTLLYQCQMMAWCLTHTQHKRCVHVCKCSMLSYANTCSQRDRTDLSVVIACGKHTFLRLRLLRVSGKQTIQIKYMHRREQYTAHTHAGIA